jgi:uncharacterized protein (TIGR02284 family)
MAKLMDTSTELNLDPITGEPGAHPLGTGLGAAAGGAAAGAAMGLVAGPAGALAGGIVGAIAGGLGGKEAAEAINPTAEAAYWESAYDKEHYYEAGRPFGDYEPAYGLGWTGYSRYGGNFEARENDLALEWGQVSGGSTLTWPQARQASRAAWMRAEQRRIGEDIQELDDDDTIDTLNDLLESCRDGEFGFRECAEHTKSQDIKTVMLARAEDCRKAGAELIAEVLQLGGEVESGGTASGAMHRGWVAVKGSLMGYTDLAMLDECERGEDAALAAYRKALKDPLPARIQALVMSQQQGAQRNHDQIKSMRDLLKVKA